MTCSIPSVRSLSPQWYSLRKSRTPFPIARRGLATRRNDGFVKTKHRGHIDLRGEWPAIRDRWVEMFRNRESHAGESVTQQVTANDEWCAEAYMETDYSTLTQMDYERKVKKYILFRVMSEDISGGRR